MKSMYVSTCVGAFTSDDWIITYLLLTLGIYKRKFSEHNCAWTIIKSNYICGTIQLTMNIIVRRPTTHIFQTNSVKDIIFCSITYGNKQHMQL